MGFTINEYQLKNHHLATFGKVTVLPDMTQHAVLQPETISSSVNKSPIYLFPD